MRPPRRSCIASDRSPCEDAMRMSARERGGGKTESRGEGLTPAGGIASDRCGASRQSQPMLSTVKRSVRPRQRGPSPVSPGHVCARGQPLQTSETQGGLTETGDESKGACTHDGRIIPARAGPIRCQRSSRVRPSSSTQTQALGTYSSTKWDWMNWIVSADFPTPPPPTTTSLYSRRN